MIELLELCGFSTHELESELPRVKRTFNKLGINAEDIKRAKQRLNTYYDLELQGVRQLLRLHIKSVVNTLLAREEGKKKIVYGFMAPGFYTFAAALVSKSREVQVTFLCPHFQLVIGSIFDKIVPVLEAAEQKWVKAGGVTHCGNVKSLVGLFALDLLPKPDLLVTAGFLCETAPKTIDLLHELYGVPVSYYDTCQDVASREVPEATKRTIDFAMKSMRKLVERIQEVVGFEITDDMLLEVLDTKSKLDSALGKLNNLIENGAPLLISANHPILWMYSAELSVSGEGLPSIIEAVNTLREELQERATKEVLEKGVPRVLALLPPHHADPRPDYLLSELGMSIVATDLGFSTSDVPTSRDPYEIIASEIIGGSFSSSPRRKIPLLIEGCKRLYIEGVLDRFHIGCRTVAGDVLLIKDAITRELDIPVVLQERDDFDPRVYNHEQYRISLETFRTILSNSRERRLE
jgi:hypothetical protein